MQFGVCFEAKSNNDSQKFFYDPMKVGLKQRSPAHLTLGPTSHKIVKPNKPKIIWNVCGQKFDGYAVPLSQSPREYREYNSIYIKTTYS